MTWEEVFSYKIYLGSLTISNELIYSRNKVNAALLLIFMLHFFFSLTNHLPGKTGAATSSHGTTSGIVQVLHGLRTILLSIISLSILLKDSKVGSKLLTFWKCPRVIFVFTSDTARYQENFPSTQNLAAQIRSREIGACLEFYYIQINGGNRIVTQMVFGT